jgi:hypothetical protein
MSEVTEDSDFWEIAGKNDERSPIFAKLGAFISFYASTETMLHMFLRQQSGIEDGIARIAFLGVRNDDLIKKISDILEITKASMEQQDRIDRIFKQFREISKMRNRLIHRLSHAAGESLLSHGHLNSVSLNDPLNFIEYKLSDIRGATYDLSMMYQEIGWIANILHPELPTLPSDFRYQQFLTYTWQYKPPAPYRPGQSHAESSTSLRDSGS